MTVEGELCEDRTSSSDNSNIIVSQCTYSTYSYSTCTKLITSPQYVCEVPSMPPNGVSEAKVEVYD